MSLYAFFGAVEQGLLFSIMALGVFITFRALDFPDLSVDGTFPMGAAISAILIFNGVNPWITIAIAVAGGMAAGAVTAILNTRLKILNLLAGILTMIALYSVNLRIMGMPNVPLLGFDTVFTSLENTGIPAYMANVIILGSVAVLVGLFLIWFFHTEVGLALRATGDNMKMVKAQGASTNRMILIGVALSNGLVALAGALAAQVQGFAVGGIHVHRRIGERRRDDAYQNQDGEKERRFSFHRFSGLPKKRLSYLLASIIFPFARKIKRRG